MHHENIVVLRVHTQGAFPLLIQKVSQLPHLNPAYMSIFRRALSGSFYLVNFLHELTMEKCEISLQIGIMEQQCFK